MEKIMNTERDIVAKFGGSSLANAEGYRDVANIVNADAKRRIIAVSAPGIVRDNPLGDEERVKITDLLIACGRISFRDFPYHNTLGMIESRFLRIAEELKVCIEDDLEEIRNGLATRKETEDLSLSWAASRGEWLSAKILARYLGANFVDAQDLMKFHEDGSFDQDLSYNLINERLRGSERFIVPGFYGQDSRGRIRILPRGGSDITGAYLAAALNAQVYENWTNTNGVFTADPDIVPQARTIPYLFYEEMAELGLLGAKVFHPLALGPVWARGIPVNVRNTFNPEHPGTWIGDMYFLLEKRLI